MRPFALSITGEFEGDEVRHFLNARSEVTDWVQGNDNLYIIRSEKLDPTKFLDDFDAYLKRNKPKEYRRGMLIPLLAYGPGESVDMPGKLVGRMAKVAWDRYAGWSGWVFDWDADPVTIKRIVPELPA